MFRKFNNTNINDPEIFSHVRNGNTYRLSQYKDILNEFTDLHGNNLLHIAVAKKGADTNMINFLLDNGVNPDHKNKDDETAFDRAIQKHNDQIIQLLMDKKYKKIYGGEISTLTAKNSLLDNQNKELTTENIILRTKCKRLREDNENHIKKITKLESLNDDLSKTNITLTKLNEKSNK
jgi:ankyrin repeat protein